MNAAAIDLGTNSVKILIVRKTPEGHQQVLFKHRAAVRLGEGVFNKGKIGPKVQARTLKVLSSYAKILEAYNVDMVRATGTSALREAQNGHAFVKEVREKTGIVLEVLPASEEARLIVKGVSSEFSLPTKPIYFVDIGGGSGEVSLVQNRKISRIVSFPFGAVRLTENFLFHDPPLPAELKRLDGYLTKSLQKEWPDVVPGPQIAYGSAGTIRALARLVNSSQLRVDERVITLDDLASVAAKVAKMSKKRIATLPGIDKKRADIFTAGTRALLALFRHFGIHSLKVSNRGLREGLLLELLETPTKPASKTENTEAERVDLLLQFGRKFHSHQTHTKHVWLLAKNLFDELQPMHGLDAEARKILMSAALLHDVGHFIGEESHHKHTLYILKNTKFPFLTPKEQQMVACVARYHRKSPPKEDHDVYKDLASGEKKVVTALSAILRLADALDAPHDQSVKWVSCQWGPGKVHIHCEVRPGSQINKDVLKDKSQLFEDFFKSKLTLG